MPVIAIVNRKGGSGKSTLATHLAAYCAHAGMSVMLGDVDHQQSTKTWLRLRSTHLPESQPSILGWLVEPGRGLRPPVGTTHVVLDTPGGLTGFELARVAVFADVILMPVCNSVFDRESAADCLAELMKLPRVASGRCKVAVVGMRLDGRTRAAAVLRDWAAAQHLPFIGVLRDTQLYVCCIETGMSLFDLPAEKVQADLNQWDAILRWLEPVLYPQVPKVMPAQPALSRPRPTVLAAPVAVPACAVPAEAVVGSVAVAMAAQQASSTAQPANLVKRLHGLLLDLTPALRRLQRSAWA
jgi:chromosome partitioning protein